MPVQNVIPIHEIIKIFQPEWTFTFTIPRPASMDITTVWQMTKRVIMGQEAECCFVIVQKLAMHHIRQRFLYGHVALCMGVTTVVCCNTKTCWELRSKVTVPREKERSTKSLDSEERWYSMKYHGRVNYIHKYRILVFLFYPEWKKKN